MNKHNIFFLKRYLLDKLLSKSSSVPEYITLTENVLGFEAGTYYGEEKDKVLKGILEGLEEAKKII